MAAPGGTRRSSPDIAPCRQADVNRWPSPGSRSNPVAIGRRPREGHVSKSRRQASVWIRNAPRIRHGLVRRAGRVRRPFRSDWLLLPAQVLAQKRAGGGIGPRRQPDRSSRLAVSRGPVSRFRRPTRSLHWAGTCRGRHRRRGSAPARRFPPAPARRHRLQRSLPWPSG